MASIYYVYIHKTKDSDEIFYVGKGKHKRAYSRCGRNKFWKNIELKHGFTVEFLAKDLSELDALAMEIDIIASLKPRANLTLGGQGTSGYKHSPELVAWRNENNRRINKTYEGHLKKSDAQKIAQNRPEVALKRKEGVSLFIEKVKCGEVENPWKGPVWTDEQKQQISERQKGSKAYWYGKTTAVAQKIVNLDSGEVFESIKKAADSVRGRYRSLSQSLKVGRRYKKVRFAYHKDV